MNNAFYVEAIYPALLLDDRIPPELDLRARPDRTALRYAVDVLRVALADGTTSSDGSAVSRLEQELYEDEVASAAEPTSLVEVDLSHSDLPAEYSELVEYWRRAADGQTTQ